MSAILQHKKTATSAIASATLAICRRALLPVVAALFCAGLFAASLAHAEEDNRPVVIVAFGDSLTSGSAFSPDEGFASQLQIQLRISGINATVINAGLDGDTSADGLNRTDWMLEDKPQMVIVELGANDMLRGFPVAAMRDNLDAIIGKIKQSGAKVLIAGMYATANLGEQYQKQFSEAYTEIAQKHNVLLYPFFLQGVYDNPKLMLEDGKHPNAQGIKVIAKNITPLVVQTLDKE